MPKFYIKTMVELEEHLADNAQKDKSAGKKKAGNTKAMNNLKQKLRKLSKEYEESIAAYKKVKKKNRQSSSMKFNTKIIFRILRNS